jgi:hypothetical protein
MGRTPRGPRLLAAFAFAVLAFPATAAADSSTELPLEGLWGMAVDAEHEHVFVSGHPIGDTITVLDFDGTIVGTITGQQGASGLVVDPATDTLYAALRNADAISTISTVTLAETGRIPVAPLESPSMLALAGGRLWFGHDCSSGGGTGSVDLDGTDVTDYPTDFPANCPLFATTQTNPNVLVSGNLSTTVPTIYVHDVSTTTPTLLRSVTEPGDMGRLNDLRVTQDGTRLVVAGQSLDAIQVLDIADLTLDDSYPTVDGPQATAVTSDAGFVAAGATDPITDADDLAVYPAGQLVPVRTWDFGEDPEVVPWGLQFTPDSSTLFAVTQPGTGENLEFRVLTTPTVARLQTTLGLTTSRSTVNYNQKVTVTATLNGATAGRQVTFYAEPEFGPRTAIATGTTNSLGKLSRVFAMKGETTFSAEFAGDATYDAANSANRIVRVRALTKVTFSGFYRKSGKYRLYRLGKSPKLTGRVTPNHAGQFLKFVAQRQVGRRWRTFDTGTFGIESTGAAYVIVRIRARGNIRIKATFAGDADHLGSTSPWAYARIT